VFSPPGMAGNKKGVDKMRLVLLALAGLCLMPLVFAGTCPVNSSTNIAVYGQTGTGGVGDLSRSWMVHFFDWWNAQDPSVSYAILDAGDVKSDCVLTDYPNLSLYVQPGGDAYKQQRALSQAGKNNILGFIDSGKAYLGVCAGFYYAAGDYYWQGSYYDWRYLLGRFPTVEGSITDIADYDDDPPYAVTGLDNGHHALYYGGPTRGWSQTPSTFPGTKMASFAAISGELPAAVMNGNMLLTSVHLEAYENDGISGLGTAQRVENYKWLANMLNEVANTSFYVPAYAQCHDGVDNDGDGDTDYPDDPGCTSIEDDSEINPQCSDGLDNDNDSLTDYPDDPGCASASDDDETDVSGPAELLFDGFEGGSLAGWTLDKVSGANYWTAATTNPYEGSYHAQANPRSTSEPATSMERAVSTSGYSTVTVSYYRRLVGLDVADEFKAKWFDGNGWNVMEETGTSSANDAAYVYKQFVLPSQAGDNPDFGIKFECTAGATSEYCRVDNVNVTAE
jgi:hypothetical protein